MKIINKKAKFLYSLEEEYEAGLVLTGAEVRAVKNGRANISQAVARIMDTEAYLINADIVVDNIPGYQSKRIRKLLLHKDQIISIKSKIKAKKLTLVPLSLYTKGRLVKVKLALGKEKRRYQKREAIRQRDIEREMKRELKNR